MRWLTPLFLITTITVFAQDGLGLEEIASESSASLDELGYQKPAFQWNMEGRVQAALNEGINSLDEGNPNLALPNLEEATKLDPNLWVAHYYKGVCLKQLKRYRDAEKSFLAVNDLTEKNIYNYMELGKTYGLLKEANKAERYFERARDIDKTNAHPVYLLANHCVKTGYVDRAKRLYKDCLEVDPKLLDAEVKLALIEAAQRKSLKYALKYIEDVLAKDSMHRQALLFHGIMKYETDKKASLKDWDKLVRLNPTNVAFRYIRGMLSTANGDYDKAFSDLRKVIDEAHTNENKFTGQQSELDKKIDIQYAGFYVVANVYGLPDDDAFLVKKAYCLLFPGNFDESLRSISKVKGARTSPLCLFLRGVANEHKGQHNAAFYAYDSALFYDKDIIDAHKKRGIYFTELKRWTSAEQDFNEMLRINPESFIAYRFRGLARYNNLKFQESIDDFTKYLQYDTADREVHGYRAMGYRSVGEILPSTLDLLKSKHAEALEDFSKISGEINKLLVKGDTTKGLWWLKEFIKAEPGFIDSYKMTVTILMSQKKWAEVKNISSEALKWTMTEGQADLHGIKYKPDDEVFFLTVKGLSLIEVGEPLDAIRLLNGALERDKKSVWALQVRGKAYLKANNKQAAVKDLERAAKMGDKEAENMLKQL